VDSPKLGIRPVAKPTIATLRSAGFNAECSLSNVGTIPAQYAPPSLDLAAGDLPRLVVTASQAPQLDLARCDDASCTTFQRGTCLASLGEHPSLALDPGGAPLVAFELDEAVQVLRPPVACSPMVTIQNASVVEATAPASTSLRFEVSLVHPAAAASLVSYSTVDGSAQGGLDYQPVSGTLTFVPGQPLDQFVDVPVVPDSIDENEESLELVLSAPVNAGLADDRAVGTILDDDGASTALHLRGDCAVVEGDAGLRQCQVEAYLTKPTVLQVRVDYYTANQSALGGVDYLATSGTLTFPPGTLSQTVSVSVIGDVGMEADETFVVGLINAVNALAGDFQSIVTIVDDDAPSLSQLELTHGSLLTADLAPDPGPVPDQDLYHFSQAPFSSYEAVFDAVSGDAVPGTLLDRVAPDGSTILQAAAPVGTGPAAQMRFLNRLAAPVDNQYLRVRGASCGTACGPDDTYRLRLYETTGVIPRFNNVGSQVTVLIVQNITDRKVQGYADFWSVSGVLLRSVPVILPPRWSFVLDTTTNPFLAGTSGTVTLAHDGPYGGLAGKAVALEPSTGFSFDSPMASKPG
jgi:hypothetical protein